VGTGRFALDQRVVLGVDPAHSTSSGEPSHIGDRGVLFPIPSDALSVTEPEPDPEPSHQDQDHYTRQDEQPARCEPNEQGKAKEKSDLDSNRPNGHS
jgi:hypothetical protein